MSCWFTLDVGVLRIRRTPSSSEASMGSMLYSSQMKMKSFTFIGLEFLVGTRFLFRGQPKFLSWGHASVLSFLGIRKACMV